MKTVFSFTVSITLILLFTFSCKQKTNNTDNELLIKQGEGNLKVEGGSIWYKVSGDGKGVPLVLLHGGPGYSSYYLKLFEQLGSDRPVIRYDQLGSGKSDIITDTSLFTIKHYVNELEKLREHLKIDNWNILGHSWGTILAFEYYTKFPKRVNSLIMASPCLDLVAWEESTNNLLKNLPDTLYKAVLKADSTGNYNNPLYEEAISMFYSIYLFGENPVKEDLDSILATANLDIYEYMWGPSEFTIIGTLEDYNVTDKLHSINVPTLFTVGEFDEIEPSIVRDMASKIVNSNFEIYKGSCHLTPWGAPEESIKVTKEFLDNLDNH